MTLDIEKLKQRHQELLGALSADVIDPKVRSELQRELSHITGVLDQQLKIDSASGEIAEATEQLSTIKDAGMQELFKSEIAELTSKRALLQQELENSLIPKDEHDDRSVFLEIRSGAGGQEAALFVADLVKMYTNYATSQSWQVEVVDETLTDIGGIRDITLHIQGRNVYGHLKYEIGVHRVQRVPKTETQGRVHTSTATVAVFPEAKEVDVQINQSDLRIDVFRSSGAGGQHVNTTDSAVRITHIPTGTVVSCQDERSQLKNKNKALKMLQSRILAHQKEVEAASMAQKRKAMVGRGMRAEKVRTYNYPQNRVTDHQVELTLKKLDRVMLGDLGDIVDALRNQEREERKKEAFEI